MKGRKWLCVFFVCMLLGAAAAEMEFADLSGAFQNRFSDEETLQTENSYRSANLSIQIMAQRAYESDVYTADLHVRTAECIGRAFGGGVWDGSSEKIGTLAQQSGAVLALTGDNSHLLKAGWLVGNGQLWRQRGNNKRDLCVLYTDGRMEVCRSPVDHELIAHKTSAGEIWQTFVFGPSLLDEESRAISDFSHSDVAPENPRAAIGYYQPGHYCLVQVDGRGTASRLQPGAANEGMTLAQLSQFMQDLGCTAAYNLDGGQSAAMWFGGEIISTPYHNGRAVGDAIVLCEPACGLQENIDDFLVE